jgi:hypothetical protein
MKDDKGLIINACRDAHPSIEVVMHDCVSKTPKQQQQLERAHTLALPKNFKCPAYLETRLHFQSSSW